MIPESQVSGGFLSYRRPLSRAHLVRVLSKLNNSGRLFPWFSAWVQFGAESASSDSERSDDNRGCPSPDSPVNNQLQTLRKAPDLPRLPAGILAGKNLSDVWVLSLEVQSLRAIYDAAQTQEIERNKERRALSGGASCRVETIAVR
jgi:hypothetical protein